MAISQKQIEKKLREYVKELCREHKFLEKQLERATRYAPPVGQHLRDCQAIERQVAAVEKKMTRIEHIVDRLPTSPYSYAS